MSGQDLSTTVGKTASIPEAVPGRVDPTQPLPEPRQTLLTESFFAWCRQSPSLTAIRQEGRSWTYEALGQCAQTLAEALVAKGVRPGDVVAVYGSRCFGLIAAMLGVFRSGGVLLSLDKILPDERKRVMLEQAAAKKVICVGAVSDLNWLEQGDVELVFVDDDGDQNEKRSSDAPLPEIGQNDAAYIFFTSGTTGVPKGVLGCHKGLAHFLNWQRSTFDIGPGDRHSQLTGLSFDVVLRDIFLPLTSGATVCLPDEGMHVGSESIFSWMRREAITVVHATPTLAQHWLGGQNLTQPPPLRYVFSAGEPLLATLVRRWRKVIPDCEVINLYGPTETTLAKFYYRVPAEFSAGIQPLGMPLPQTQALVLAPDGQLCADGVSGEIVIRTPFRSIGYINASEENKRRFVKNPFRDDDKDILYYTGDLGRYRSDGLLEIMGRVDDQVKIRGERVEPSEITAVLARHASVKNCFTRVSQNDRDEDVLVAYVVPQNTEHFQVAELRSYLRGILPEVMIPSVFVALDELPLTPNGKVDRRNLPQPDSGRQDVGEDYVAPRNSVEQRLVEIWQRVMRLEPIGIRDDFYDLGGHSMLALRLFTAINKAFKKNFAIEELFRATTIEKLALIVQQEHGSQAESALITIQPQGNRLPFYCIPGIYGGLLYFRNLAKHLGNDQPFYGLRQRGLDRRHAPFTEIEDIAADFVAKVRAYQPEGPYQIGGHSYGCTVAYEVARQLREKGEEVNLLLLDYLLNPSQLWAGANWWGVFKFHLQAMSTVNFWKKIWYVLNTFAAWVITSKTFKKICKVYREKGRPLPPGVRFFNRPRLINILAQRHFKPKPYPGRITVFLIEDNEHDQSLGLPGQAEAGFEICRVAGDHNTMLEEPHVRDVARKLEKYLASGERTVTSGNNRPEARRRDD